ncbi:MAG: hypothetical protein FRX49_12069 [Trebouxia sp. A1-2]|nr:MAG: hypothetical protein FRX49_12069 [Trebouxia sp. A1-2]
MIYKGVTGNAHRQLRLAHKLMSGEAVTNVQKKTQTAEIGYNSRVLYACLVKVPQMLAFRSEADTDKACQQLDVPAERHPSIELIQSSIIGFKLQLLQTLILLQQQRRYLCGVEATPTL